MAQIIPMQEQHIYPIFDKTLTRNDRETLLKQKAKVIWFTGLSGSGKSTHRYKTRNQCMYQKRQCD
jgi:adenylylsulfate kinase-like enzyme